ncbi:ATP-binding protein [candidate division KSB1 bacterium]|nr:ATP-binding protein [candidate division KSB1 bacterium]
MKKLPISIQDFDRLITGNHVYVDKSRYIYKMVTEGMFYFLSRPRRFGKSLLVSTLEHLFRGNKKLFKGLWIEKADWAWKPHPVLKIDFNGVSFGTPEILRQSLLETLRLKARKAGAASGSSLLRNCFKEMIIKLFEKHRQQVVVLIDEYDQPLISHLGKGEAALETAKQNREVLRELYGVLKESDVNQALQFVFITGISKFAQVSIFSELNNLDDISMQDPYSTLLGYTEEELEKYFAVHLKQLSKQLKRPQAEVLQQIQAWYNGYRFSDADVKVYNPVSVLKLLKQNKFKSYWFETATPAFLVDLIKEQQYPVPLIETLELSQEDFTVYDLDYLQLEPLLFQTGYITIKDYEGELYRLSYPNQEVKTSWLKYLYDQLVAIRDSSLKTQFKKLQIYLRQEQLERFIETTNAILAAIPYQHIENQDEHFYHTVFYLMLSASGALAPTEVLTSRGRIDMEVHFPEKIYIVELKCNQSAEQAIAQIKAKKYFEKHLHSGRKIILLGINFSTSERHITDWQVEQVAGRSRL